MIAGILLCHYQQIPLAKSYIWLVILLFLSALMEWLGRKKTGILNRQLSVLFFLTAIFLFGIFRMGINQAQQEPPLIRLIAASPWEEITLSGQILSISHSAAGKERWELRVTSTEISELVSDKAYKARVLAEENQQPVTLGDYVRFTGTIIPVSEPRNPHDFDYGAYLKSQGISCQIKLTALQHAAENTSKAQWVWWREKAIALTHRLFDDQTSPIAKALLIGYKQDLDYEDKTAFARTGLSHIMAVSGLHVGFIVAPFWLVIPFLWTKKYGREAGLFLLIAILFVYAGLTGFSASVMRAALMAAFITFSKLFHKLNNSINVTAASCIVLLIINPEQLFQIGFQLSYAAVLIILLVMPVIQNKLPYWMQYRWYGAPVSALIVSMVVQIGLFPLQIHYFREISIISPVANAIFVPFLGVVIPLSLLSVIVSAVAPAAGYVLNYFSFLFLKVMHWFVINASTWEWAWAYAELGSPLFFLFWLFLIFAITSLSIPALRWKMLIGGIAVLCVIQSGKLFRKMAVAPLEVVIFDVGQGDAALLRTPSGKHILIDAGLWTPTANSASFVILPHLKKAGIRRLHAVVLSHPHSDHIGGISNLIEEIPIDTIYHSDYEYESNLYQSYIQKAQEKNIPLKAVQSGYQLPLDDAVLMLVLGPEGIKHNNNPNEHSVILNVIYGDTEFLFMGDAGEHQERRLLQHYGSLLDIDFLKVGHHGSRTSSGSQFLEVVTPEVAVISLAENNRFGHPHSEAVSRLAQTDAQLLFTSREKALIFRSDGHTITRILWDK